MSAAESPALAADRLAGWDPIGLDEVVEVADLQTRFDTKYLVPLKVVDRFTERLSGIGRVLEVEGERLTGYRTTYFDTPDLMTYRWHVQRRRRRYKIRTRTYLGRSTTTMLEVKVKAKGGRTVKHRVEHPAERPDQLTPAALEFVARILDDTYGFALPSPLEVSATTNFWRTTVVVPGVGERVTIDQRLVVEMQGTDVAFDEGHVLMETKSPQRRGTLDRLLRELGVRATNISKYGVGIAMLRPDQPSNRWRPALRKLQAASTLAD